MSGPGNTTDFRRILQLVSNNEAGCYICSLLSHDHHTHADYDDKDIRTQ